MPLNAMHFATNSASGPILTLITDKYGARIRQRSKFTPTGEKKAGQDLGRRVLATAEQSESQDVMIVGDEEACVVSEAAGSSQEEDIGDKPE